MEYDCLIVDDETSLGMATCEYFQMFGVSAAFVSNSVDCLDFLQHNQVKLILLDINLEGESGFALCVKLKQTTNIPILFISARKSEDDILVALNIGGDDYIQKPYSLNILLAKVRIAIKRQKETQESIIPSTYGLYLDTDAMKVFVDGGEVKLKTKEYKLLEYLYRNKNKVVHKKELFDNVWGDEFFSDGTLNVHIRKIREKIERNPNEPELIKTVWGTGYRLEL